MFGSSRSAPADLGVLLELSPGPDGRLHGQLDGVPLSLERGDRIRIPLTGGWPGAIVSLREPAEGEVGRPGLRIRSSRPGWMSAALKRALSHADVRTALDAVPSGTVRVDVEDHAVRIALLEARDGPSVRRTVRAFCVLARALPTAMSDVVGEGVAADLRSRTHQARRGIPARADSPEEQLSQQYERYVKRLGRLQWTTFLGAPVLMVAGVMGMAFAGVSEGVALIVGPTALFASVGYGVYRMRKFRFTDPCPRCGVRRDTLSGKLVDDARCPNCQLRPLRPPRLIRAGDLDINL